MATRKKRVVSDEQKAAMAEGRAQSRALAPYLEALETHRPKRGRKRTPESIDRRLAAIREELRFGKQIKRVALLQERRDLIAERQRLDKKVDLTAYEEAFVANAKSYSERRGITYEAWRELGVPASVLKRAGISRSRS
ncbi:MAG: hypothetical protein KY438_04785 [Actinobacteria bacterium]|nr:hypothetical protein [Actinomycetota bacterium]